MVNALLSQLFLECVAGLNDRKGCIFTNDEVNDAFRDGQVVNGWSMWYPNAHLSLIDLKYVFSSERCSSNFTWPLNMMLT